MAGCGYTPAIIDALEMHDVGALLTLWRERPPAHEILAAVYQVKTASAPDAADPSGIGALIARAPDGRLRTPSPVAREKVASASAEVG